MMDLDHIQSDILMYMADRTETSYQILTEQQCFLFVESSHSQQNIKVPLIQSIYTIERKIGREILVISQGIYMFLHLLLRKFSLPFTLASAISTFAYSETGTQVCYS